MIGKRLVKAEFLFLSSLSFSPLHKPCETTFFEISFLNICFVQILFLTLPLTQLVCKGEGQDILVKGRLRTLSSESQISLI